MRIKKIGIPIYYGYLIVLVSNDFKAVADKYDLKETVEHYGAFAWTRRNKNGIAEFLVCVPLYVTGDLIAHEVVHIINAIFLDKGIELDRHNDEPQAYLTGWVFRQIEEFLNKVQKEKSKHTV